MSSIKNEEIYKSIYGNENLSSEDIMEISNVIQLISIWTNDNPGGIVDYRTIRLINEDGSRLLRFVYTQSVNNSPKKYVVTLFLIDDVRCNICDKSSIGYIKCDDIDGMEIQFYRKKYESHLINTMANQLLDSYKDFKNSLDTSTLVTRRTNCDDYVENNPYQSRGVSKLSAEDQLKLLKSLNDVIDKFMYHTTHFDDEGFWDKYK
jgi:hypothetical protein|nr:MAG TPA: hypothetical protein [Caudoviricetes sp.]DAX79932.1 MAG TPA: hypothetical protein [Caudoviricetes sp.]